MTRGSCTVAMNPGCAWVAPGTTFRRDVQVRARKGREYRGSCATHNQKVADSNPAPATMTPPFPPPGGRGGTFSEAANPFRFPGFTQETVRGLPRRRGAAAGPGRGCPCATSKANEIFESPLPEPPVSDRQPSKKHTFLVQREDISALRPQRFRKNTES